MQYLFFAAILLFYLYRSFSVAQKKAKEDAERRRIQNPQIPNQQDTPVPQKSIEQVLTEVFRETEMKTKPYGDGRKRSLFEPPKKSYEKKPVVQRPAYKPIQAPKKKEASPFLTTDYSPELVDAEGTPSAMSKESEGKIQSSDAYRIKGLEGKRINFNIRDAVIAKIILDRPEW